MMKRTLLSISAATLMATAYSQSDGRSFDAAVVMVPGMTIERSGVIYGGDYTNSLLQHGDILRTDMNQGDPFYVLTSDGSVINLAPNAEINIDGNMNGFNVFQVMRGSTQVVGNVADGYNLPNYFSRYVSMVARNVAAPTYSSATETPYVNGNYGVISTPYANVVNGPSYGVYDPYNMVSRGAITNHYVVPWRSNTIISPWGIY